jgi:hypothetical protein
MPPEVDLKMYEVSKEEETQFQDEVAEIEPEKIETPVSESPKEIIKEAPKEEVKAETKEPEKLVPLSALNETRWELRQMKKQMAIIDEVKKALDEQKKSQEIPAPDPTLDPIGAQEHKLKQIAKQQEELTNKIEETNTRTQNQDFLIKVTQMESNFKQSNPDYEKAFNFLSDVRKGELQDLGVNDPEDMNKQLTTSAINLSRFALQQGKNPAEVIYNMAKRYGYKSEDTKQVATQDAVLKQAIKESGKDTLSSVEKGQKEASKTLSGAGETEIQANVTALLNAKGAEFDKLWDELFES